jgi:chromosome segregation protein
VRSVVSQLDIARATADADLSHLAHTCEDAVNATLEQVIVEVEQLEAEGKTVPDASAICADEPDESDEDAVRSQPDAVVVAEQRTLSAEEAIAALRAKIDRLGPVNMMAIEQFDELETRHVFLTGQRKDLVESIQLTSEAIRRIDETTRQRFSDAFAAINTNFQQMFSTLFGGGRAGLTLLDENDPLESGIEIIAQPPGKRLQSVQLLRAGKALTAVPCSCSNARRVCLLTKSARRSRRANIGGSWSAARRTGTYPVHRHHPQPEDHGDRRPALRRHHGGARGFKADFGSVELRYPRRRMYCRGGLL